MLVKDIMKRDVITITEEDTVATALQLLQKHHIRHIPVIDEKKQVIGIVSDRDVRDASPSILDAERDETILTRSIKEVMTSPVVTTHPLEFFEEVATIFYQKEFACLPVVRNKQLVGMITEKDMLQTFIQLTGTHSPSTQMELKVPDRVGVLADVCQYFKQHHIKIVSVYGYPDPKTAGYKVLVFRIQTINPMPVIRAFEESEFDILYPYLEDQDEI
ncbi:CBS and ACT domain-containing protein [Gracilibacillus alcaliphilus]|uniref:CBS and ACT domain-containing protein n=1 Tax=Gracilibacillus alcaliphilus TaxID=1401441 RepID=UPI001957D4D8|nr:CBS and ACT domain-containing protein [Gracilibacillus alcaliphilus]MBM7679453.1 acetoin utilization protein AcuB [Gracilibacillus alcaliphilus]